MITTGNEEFAEQDEPVVTSSEQRVVDAVIIGAGAAGLAAARDLRSAGREFVVVEAQSRVGGRIFTYRDPRVPVPLELGAEFLHGTTPETSAILDEAGLIAVDVIGDHWTAEDGDFTAGDDFWDDVDRVLDKLDEHQTPDRSFADFLADRASRGKNKPKHRRRREAARQFVQGFHAADPERVSERWLAMEGDAESELAGAGDLSRSARVVEGYDRIPAFLARQVFDAVMLNSVVERVDWSEGSVTVHVRRGEANEREQLRARALIVTVPVGVLQVEPPEPGAIEFVPEVPGLRDAVAQLAMGSVVRTVLAFTHRFWEDPVCDDFGSGSLESLSFLHLPNATVPIWWTQFPLRAPVLVGWTGGPPAAELCALPDEEIAHRALRDLAGELGTSADRLEESLVGHWSHNWDRDPFTRGAYSYAVVGGSGAARRLGRPVEGTIFFAGEATETGGRSGTVEGAISSGRRAARAVLQALG